MKKLVYIILGVVGLISCSTQKGVSVKEKEITYESPDEEKLFQEIQKPIEFSTLKIKAITNIETDSQSQYPSVGVTLYIDKGKQIWANATLVLSLARASILPKGFKMYERVGKTYVDSDFEYVNNMLKVDFIDYQSIENLLIGKIFFPVNPDDFITSIQDNQYVLTSVNLIKAGSGKNLGSFSRKLTFDSDFNLRQIVVEDKSRNTYLQIDYTNYVNIENTILPENIKIFIKEKKETKISLDYNKFEFTKMDTPFEIPKGYTQRKIN
ncbi:MAG: DUF4292 domain-containing protein [Flavobacteriaceae bacterium]|jgi:hypothetical protein|nr:DUF4292 domain-containing protein [Flavobacteriaceae bacterium]